MLFCVIIIIIITGMKP